MMPAPTTRRDAGFTLLELIVVLALAALAARLAMPVLTDRRLDVPAAARDVASLMKAARADAMRVNAPRTVSIDLANRRVWRDSGSEARDVSASVSLEAITIASERPSPTLARIRFYPDGSATGGEVRFADARSRAVVRVDWLTGAASVVEGAP